MKNKNILYSNFKMVVVHENVASFCCFYAVSIGVGPLSVEVLFCEISCFCSFVVVVGSVFMGSCCCSLLCFASDSDFFSSAFARCSSAAKNAMWDTKVRDKKEKKSKKIGNTSKTIEKFSKQTKSTELNLTNLLQWNATKFLCLTERYKILVGGFVFCAGCACFFSFFFSFGFWWTWCGWSSSTTIRRGLRTFFFFLNLPQSIKEIAK